MREEGGALEENHANTPVYIFLLTISETSHHLLLDVFFF